VKIVNHRLCHEDGTPYPFVKSPNMGGKLTHEYLVMHYTAGRTAEGAVKWLTNEQARASAHLVIGRDGGITQLVPFDRIAWHAGASRWEGREGLNRYSIGIELDNAGRLTRHEDRWRAWFGVDYDASQVIEAVHKNETELWGWHTYPPEQIEVALDVANVLIAKYDLFDVIGHEDIAPGRKSDPGPAFPMASFASRLLGRRQDAEVQYETIANLNIRTGPGTQHPTLTDQPLPVGTRLEIVRREGLWALVEVLDVIEEIIDLEGWVHTHYIKRVVEPSEK
jgi:N-acetylmuramoyl-L-alanine amidase